MARATTISDAVPKGKKAIWLISLLALIILVLSGWAWWHYVRSNPQRTFNAMLENNLKSTGVTDRLISDGGEGGIDQDQIIQLVTSPHHQLRAHTVISRGGENAASVKTETIGTRFADNVRYLEVIEGQGNGAGRPFDFDKVKDLWGKTADTESPDEPANPSALYTQTVLAVVPIGNVSYNDRRELMKQIRNEGVYTVDYSKVERTINNGRPEYTYPVNIKVDAYVGLLKNFAQSQGFTHLDQVEPAEYAGSEPIKVTLVVDVWAQRLSRIIYDNAQDPSQARSEVLSSFGGQHRVKLPEETIPIDELHMRVQSLQQ